MMVLLVVLSGVGISLVLNSAAATEGSSTGRLLVANKGEATLGIVDPARGQQVAIVPEGGITGHEVIASPDGKTAFVPIYGNSGVGLPGTDGSVIAVIDLATKKVRATVDLGRGLRPHCPVIGPKNGLLYVTTELANEITVIDPITLKIVAKIPTGQPQSHMLAISNDGKRGYTANVAPGTVSALDLEARKVIKVIPVASQIQRISVSLDGRMVFTADQKEPRLAVIDTATNTVKSWVALPGIAYGTAPTLDGKWLLITQLPDSKVAVLDLSSMKIAHVFDVPPSPQEIIVRPDNKVAYISCDKSAKIAVLNLETWKMDTPIEAGKGTDGLAWAKQ